MILIWEEEGTNYSTQCVDEPQNLENEKVGRRNYVAIVMHLNSFLRFLVCMSMFCTTSSWCGVHPPHDVLRRQDFSRADGMRKMQGSFPQIQSISSDVALIDKFRYE